LWSKSFSRGSFPNTPTKCSVKCLRGDKLFLESILSGLRTCPFCPILPVGFSRAENLSVLSDFTSQILSGLRTSPFCPILPGLKTGMFLLVRFVRFYQG
jgi:hypothetical protein